MKVGGGVGVKVGGWVGVKVGGVGGGEGRGWVGAGVGVWVGGRAAHYIRESHDDQSCAALCMKPIDAYRLLTHWLTFPGGDAYAVPCVVLTCNAGVGHNF